jgi:DNA-binding NarL/FixJ family response regulator
MTTKILIADDEPLIRCGIQSQLSLYCDFEIVGEAANWDEATQLVINAHPDIMLLEPNIPGVRISQIVNLCSTKKINIMKMLILTHQRNADQIEESLREGASGYVLKEEEPMVLIEGIHMIMKGKVWLSPMSAMLVAANIACKIEKVDSLLSERELEILMLLSQGMSNLQISDKLCIAERTVRYHIEKILNKLDANNRIEAVAKAVQNGWVCP